MKKIAFDLDDVIADATSFWRIEINQRTGLNLQDEDWKVPGEYWNYYENIWKTHKIDHLISIPEIDEWLTKDQSSIKMYADSLEVLTYLKDKFELSVVTARNPNQKIATEKWVSENYPGIFKEIIFANGKAGLKTKSKGDICSEIRAQYLVDDNPGHCDSADGKGVTAVLFGSYGWHIDVSDHLIRCADWNELRKYFNDEL